MWVFDWFWNALTYFGIYRVHGRLLLLGLDNAGKTTLLHMLRDDRVATHLPTQRATKEELVLGDIRFECYDLGGHIEAREVWQDYYIDVAAIIYVVDCHDHTRFAESKRALDTILMDGNLLGTPVAVLANKIDLPKAVSEFEFRQTFGLLHTTGKEHPAAAGIRPLEVFMCSIVNRSGYAEALRWIGSHF